MLKQIKSKGNFKKMTKLKFNSATAKFEEQDLDLLSLVAAGSAPAPWLPIWQKDVLDVFGCDGRGLATVDETVSFYADAFRSMGITKDMIQDCADLYASDGGVTWNKKYRVENTESSI